ncbi:TlpA family protein disulfide reductase [Kitasatospora sp. RB6PN24]|uniref:TlpA family protein disulfide reductase n=1 Tax=Kitasatospora humi TaxID=2893891 RepID=UPI001E63C5ED|nr:TlpA disulfide reductase family protein [Kitasatospora humi]MCC9307195.1 TlpA family protein disulfide reductase [Kitasatospora humi]
MNGTKRSATVLAAAATAVASVLAGCSAFGSPGGTGQSGFVAAKGSAIATVARGHRLDAPDISGKTVDGRSADLAGYRGKVVVVNIWASWCDPCRGEAKGLESLWEKYRGQGVQFLGINTRDGDPANAVAFERDKGVTFPSLYDPDGVQILKFPKGAFDPQSIPTTLVVDRDGKLAARVLGGQSEATIESMLRPVLAEQGDA